MTHRCEGAGAGAVVGSASGGGSHYAAVGNQHHILAAELLFQLPHQPLLDPVKRLEQPVRHLHTAEIGD